MQTTKLQAKLINMFPHLDFYVIAEKIKEADYCVGMSSDGRVQDYMGEVERVAILKLEALHGV